MRVNNLTVLLAASLLAVLGNGRPAKAVEFELLDVPVQVSDGLWFLGTGPSPDEFNLKMVTNVNAADSTNADQLWSGGGQGLNLSGSGVTVGIWDGGDVRATHNELTGRVNVIDGLGISNHSTHVAGTIGGTGVYAPARGMAGGVNIRSRNFTNDLTEMSADASLIDLSNHSYSYTRGWTTSADWGIGPVDTWYNDRSTNNVEDPYFGAYDSDAQSLDGILYDNPHLLSVWSAGNDRNDTYTGVYTGVYGDGSYVTYLSVADPPTYPGTGWYIVDPAVYTPPGQDGNGGTGYDSLPGDQTAKNSLVVGAVNDVTADPAGSGDVSMTTFSSWGPTDDGRMGVDVVGNGASLTSAYGTGDSSYAGMSGTSMSAPNVTGTAALLLEHYDNLFSASPTSATMKALLAHTALDAGNIGPDYSNGWGLVDGLAAADFLTDVVAADPSSFLLEGTYDNSEQTIDIFSDGDPLKATLCWTDPNTSSLSSGLDDTTLMLVNDLDLWITDAVDSIFYPWTLDPGNPGNAAVRTSLNYLDNMVQVLIDAPDLGDMYTIHVGGDSFTQAFSLVYDGVSMVPEPATIVNLFLLGLCGIGAGWYRRRRKAAA